jgi:hypothetical protein
MTTLNGTITTKLKASDLMKMALEASSDGETALLPVIDPTRPVRALITRTPAEFISMRAGILAELAEDLCQAKAPTEICDALQLFAAELALISLEVLELDADRLGVN